MTIKQEETNPVYDIFSGKKTYDALKLVENISESISVDTELLKEACRQSILLLGDYIKDIERLEKKAAKENAKNKVLELLGRGHEND